MSIDARRLAAQCFVGLPLLVQMVTHRGALHPICAIVTDARAGQSGRSLATCQLTLRDALSVLEGRTNTRICRTLSVPDVIEKLLGEWQKKSPALARAFDFDLSSLDRAKYPVRETLLQFHESDADFIRASRGSRRRASGARPHRPTTLVSRRCTRRCSDRPMKPPQSSAGNAWRCMGSIPGGAAH
ncbi:phage late control D family protein [Paraburkholderia strydomiana]|uniref:contractile injection system protein, VgrG/Pvc8 family n=1 Tax=Paraburkholderia strydomiana TaxID=1245417 RepID=UPI0038B8121E